MKTKKAVVIGTSYLDISKISIHENVVEDRMNAYLNYLKSQEDYIVIPSIICDYKTNVLIDGHHRVKALEKLGYTSVPVTFINYESLLIRTHSEKKLRIEKDVIIKCAIEGALLKPKTTKHQIYHNNKWCPIIILSELISL